VDPLKRKTRIMLVIVLWLAVILVFNGKYIHYFTQEFFGSNIQEFKTVWRPEGRVTSFESTYNDEDFKLARLELDSSWRQVKNIYGEPFRKKTLSAVSPNNADYTVYYTYWIYPGFEVGFENSGHKYRPRPRDIGHIFVITVKTDQFQSYRGIRVGDPMVKVIERYGTPTEAMIDDRGSKFYEWQLCYLRFGPAKGKGSTVAEIELGENLD
jgi:hypothetical protein